MKVKKDEVFFRRFRLLVRASFSTPVLFEMDARRFIVDGYRFRLHADATVEFDGRVLSITTWIPQEDCGVLKRYAVVEVLDDEEIFQ